MEKPVAPADYEELIRVIHERYDSMSKGYQAIALYLTQNPNDVAVRSVNAIAERCGVHASNFVRFAQALGYTGFKDLQGLFQKRLSTAAPGFEARVKALEGELGARDGQSEDGFLRNLVARDVASLQALLTDISPDDITRAAELLEKADAVYLIGQLRSAPVVDLLRYVLTMLGKRCVLLDPSGGLATHMARTIGPGDVLVAVSFRFYATEVVNVVESVAAAGQPDHRDLRQHAVPAREERGGALRGAGARVHLLPVARRPDVPRAGADRRARRPAPERRRGPPHSDGDRVVAR